MKNLVFDMTNTDHLISFTSTPSVAVCVCFLVQSGIIRSHFARIKWLRVFISSGVNVVAFVIEFLLATHQRKTTDSDQNNFFHGLCFYQNYKISQCQ